MAATGTVALPAQVKTITSSSVIKKPPKVKRRPTPKKR